MYVIWVIGNIFAGQTFATMLCQQVSINRFHLIKNLFSNMVSLQKFLIGAVSMRYCRLDPFEKKNFFFFFFLLQHYCHSVFIVWTHNSMVEPHSSNFRVITTNFWSVRIFREFTVFIYRYRGGVSGR